MWNYAVLAVPCELYKTIIPEGGMLECLGLFLSQRVK